jgi:hypothetical protein
MKLWQGVANQIQEGFAINQEGFDGVNKRLNELTTKISDIQEILNRSTGD